MLRPYLYDRGYSEVSARDGERSSAQSPGRDQGMGGGEEGYNPLKEDSGRPCHPTMVAYYGLCVLATELGREERPRAELVFAQKAKTVEDAAFGRHQPSGWAVPATLDRFIPYVMMHEFEAMLFSDCEGLPRNWPRGSRRAFAGHSRPIRQPGRAPHPSAA